MNIRQLRFLFCHVFFTFMVIGCANSNKSADVININNIAYPLDNQGRVVLTQEEIDQFKQKGLAIYISNTLPSGAMVMTPDELNLLTRDQSAFSQLVAQDALIKPVEKNVSLNPVKETIFTNGRFRQYAPSGRVSFELTAGLLKPQIKVLLTNHQLIKSDTDVKWLANGQYQWSNLYTAQAPSLDELIIQLLSPYHLAVDFKANGIALVTHQQRGEQ